MNARAVAAVLLLAAVVGGVWWLSSDATPVGPAPVAPAPPAAAPGARPAAGDGPPAAAPGARESFQTAGECRACHEDVWKEWSDSFHGKAWTDPMVQQLSQGFRMPECIDCHAPLPIHVTGVAQRVAPRQHARSDGVDCLSCHLMEDGVSVAATRDVDTSATPGACRPRRVESMGTMDVCAGCHNQHETVDEVRASGVGKTCADCHMEPVARAGGTGRSHVFPGAHDVAMHRRATKLEAALEGRDVVVRVTNVGAGHKIPTDARHRSYNLWVTAADARGNTWVKDQPVPDGEMRLYYRDSFKPSTQVAHGATHVAKWPVPEGFRGKVVVRLTYALNPDELGAGRVTEVWTTEVQIP